MCETNGRVSKIEAVLSNISDKSIRLKLEVSNNEQPQEKQPESKTKTNNEQRNEIISNPAVKTVLLGLDAKITGIEENQ